MTNVMGAAFLMVGVGILLFAGIAGSSNLTTATDGLIDNNTSSYYQPYQEAKNNTILSYGIASYLPVMLIVFAIFAGLLLWAGLL